MGERGLSTSREILDHSEIVQKPALSESLPKRGDIFVERSSVKVEPTISEIQLAMPYREFCTSSS